MKLLQYMVVLSSFIGANQDYKEHIYKILHRDGLNYFISDAQGVEKQLNALFDQDFSSYSSLILDKMVVHFCGILHQQNLIEPIHKLSLTHRAIKVKTLWNLLLTRSAQAIELMNGKAIKSTLHKLDYAVAFGCSETMLKRFYILVDKIKAYKFIEKLQEEDNTDRKMPLAPAIMSFADYVASQSQKHKQISQLSLNTDQWKDAAV